MTVSRDAIKHSFWALPVEEVFQTLQSSESGLDEIEVGKRLKLFGPNRLKESRGLGKFRILFRQFENPLIFVLIIAGFITLWVEEFLDAIFIFGAVLVNASLGFYQENKAEESLRRLKTYVKERTIVTRDGRQKEIDSSDVVPGDVIHFSQGDRIPADARVIFANNLAVDQSFLTGESLPAEKAPETISFQADLVDQTSMVFSASLVVEGLGAAVVTATGSDTQLGKIAALLAHTRNERTPLQRQIFNFTIKASVFLGLLTIGVFFMGLYLGQPLFEMFLISVAIAVGAVPEGLPIALTVILAIGVDRLARRNGVVRKLLAAETLGGTTTILTDKTGTLTESKMAMTDVIVNPLGQNNPEEMSAAALEKDVDLRKLALKLALVNSQILIENPDDPPSIWQINARPIERALAVGAAEAGVLAPEIKGEFLDFLPFNARNRYAASLFKEKDRHFVVSFFGAPDKLLDYCDRFYLNGTLRKIGKTERKNLEEFIDKKAISGERVLGVAYRDFGVRPKLAVRDEKNIRHLIFLGLIGLKDPVRPGVIQVVQEVDASGIKVVIVTGDHRGTAEAVGRELGWVIDQTSVIDGSELEKMPPEELAKKLPLIKIFSRVTPEGKLKIVQAYQSQGERVAMVGDGVNDAPALKIADVGVAVGAGTDVAKEVADLVLLDNNFETVVSAVEEGRRIMENIRKTLVYLLSGVFDELILIGGSLLFGLALPLNALQILWVNFFSDSFPAIALAFEKGFRDFLKEKPVKRESLFDPEMKFLILVVGIGSSALIFILYYFLLLFGYEPVTVRTFVFLSFGSYTLFLTLSVRSLKKQIWEYNLFSNPVMVAAIAVGLFLLLAGIYIPAFQNIFNTVSLSGAWLAAALGFGLLNVVFLELGKWLYRQRT